MQIEQQKTISHGGKQTGKIEGGFYFVNNPAGASTVLNSPAGTYVSLGNNAGVSQLNYELFQINEYFDIITTNIPSLPQTTTQFQRLRYRKGRENTRLVLNWEISFIDSDVGVGPPEDGFLGGFRITRRTGSGIISIITSTQIESAIFSKATRVYHSTIVDINPLDSFAIEIANIDSTLNTRNASILSAALSFAE